MNKSWYLREEIYLSLHRWPSMLVLFAIGCLLGWALSAIWPASYRAGSQIHVGLNPYRTYSDVNFLALAKPSYANIDNYHTWQMSQLSSIIYMDQFIQPTLEELRRQDEYWENIDPARLRAMLKAEWRTAGTWNLMANNAQPERAVQAAKAWGDVVVPQVKEAVMASRQTFMIDQDLQATAEEQLQSTLRQQELESTRDALQEWIAAAQKLPGSQPLEPAERWRLLGMVTRLARYTPGWMAALQDQPSPEAPPGDYSPWIGQITAYIDTELEALEQRLAFLEAEQSRLSEQYSIASDKSLGLSPNLEVESVDLIATRIVRPTVTLVLVGGIVGLLIWVLIQLVMITRRTKVYEQTEMDVAQT
jgi:hypothetical protein